MKTDIDIDGIIPLFKQLITVIDSGGKASSIASITAILAVIFAGLPFVIYALKFLITNCSSIFSGKEPYEESSGYEEKLGPGAKEAIDIVKQELQYNGAQFKFDENPKKKVLKDITIEHPNLQDPETINYAVKDVAPRKYGIIDPRLPYNIEKDEFEFNSIRNEDGSKEIRPWTETEAFTELKWENSPKTTVFHFNKFLQIRSKDKLKLVRSSLQELKIIEGRFALPFNVAAYHKAFLKVNGEYIPGPNHSVDSWAPWGNMNFKKQDGLMVVEFSMHEKSDLNRSRGMLPCKELVLFGNVDPDFQIKLGDVNKIGSLSTALVIRMFPQVFEKLIYLVELALPCIVEPRILKECYVKVPRESTELMEKQFKRNMKLLKERLGLKKLRADIHPPFSSSHEKLETQILSIKRVRVGKALNRNQTRLLIWLANITLLTRRMRYIPQIVADLGINKNMQGWFI